MLTAEERAWIDSVKLDSSFILEVKQVAKVSFHKMAGAMQALKELSNGRVMSSHGVRLGYFDVGMDFDETSLEPIRKKWPSHLIYTVKQRGINRLFVE